MFLFKSYLVYFQKVFAALRQVGRFMQKKKKKKKKDLLIFLLEYIVLKKQINDNKFKIKNSFREG